MQWADAIQQVGEISYFVNQPVSIFRTYTIKLELSNTWNFDGTYLGPGSHLAYSSEFKNKWGSELNLVWIPNNLDSKILRGGPDMKVPAALYSFGQVRTDYSKKIFASVSYELMTRGENSARSISLSPGLTVRPVNTLKIGISANFGRNTDKLQYVPTQKRTPDSKYILGTIDQQTLGLTFRLDYNITPEFSFQYYGSPFVSRGTFSDLKEVTNPVASKYSQRFVPYTGPALDDPDFNFHEFRSNLVAKWEYRPGSVIYLVWSDDRTGFADPASSGMGSSMRQLFKSEPGNFFLIKLNYWFSI
jgi:hypothetical protein